MAVEGAAEVGGGGFAADGMADGEVALADGQYWRAFRQPFGVALLVLHGRLGVEGVVDGGGGLPQPGVRGGQVPTGCWVWRPSRCGELVEQLVQHGEVRMEKIEMDAVGGTGR